MLEIMKASAGSGKTYRLARKYIALLLESNDRYAYRHILAVTFTNKATDEMKGRILKELHLLASQPHKSDYHDYFIPSMFPSDEELGRKAKLVLSELLHDYSAFAVSTIDRFFQQTLKAFAREIGQFASYQVELDKDALVAESVDRILDSLTEDDSNLLSWLTDNVLEQIEQGGRYSMDANLTEMAKRLKSNQRRDALVKAGMDAALDYPKDKLLKIRESCRKIIADFRESVRSAARMILNMMEQADVDPADTNRGFLKALYAYAEIGESDVIKPPTDSFLSKARDHESWFSASKATKFKHLVYPFIEEPLNDFCSLFDQNLKVYNTALIVDNQLYGLGVAGELDRTFREIMKEKNVLCIDDSNTILHDIIDGSDAPFVYEKLGVRFEHFLLDEFQDTANVQWSNFYPLLQESESNKRDNLIVGDVKQSIYRWRGSDWQLLNDVVPASFPQHKGETLEDNYRSLANIVNFNNFYFASAARALDRMNGHKDKGPLGSIYADVRQNVAKKSEDKGNVTVTYCQKDEELDKVLEAVNEAREKGALLSEIAVLVRSNAIGEAVALYLIDNGIPVITDDSLHVKTSITVRRIVSLMSYMENPHDAVNGYLASSLEINMPESCTSLTDMAETFFRELKKNDAEGVWKGEVLHIQSFLDHVQDYVAANGNNLRGFLRYWEDENPSISSPSSGESVRVMTIHKSKGLDFPFVILPFAENINLYKSSKYWCSPDVAGTSLEGVAEGIYDVVLSKSSEHTLFSEDYRNENFLQLVDNINTIYVAMTRAALGMHVIAKMPSSKCLNAIKENDLTQFADFSQIMYWFCSASANGNIPENEELFSPFTVVRSMQEDGSVRFDVGEMVDFATHRKSKKDQPSVFEMSGGDELPSIPLDLKLGEDDREASDFFSDDGETGVSASNRIKGVVLHDIMSRVVVPSDLQRSVNVAVGSGDLTAEEGKEVLELLQERMKDHRVKDWFPSEKECIMNETSLIDVNGDVYRPDRVVVKDGSVIIVDYKFGAHYKEYVDQLKNYADIWSRMGYDEVSAFIWYVPSGEIRSV